MTESLCCHDTLKGKMSSVQTVIFFVCVCVCVCLRECEVRCHRYICLCLSDVICLFGVMNCLFN